MIFSSTSVIAEVYAGARSDATAHAAHAGASRFPRAAIGLTWQVRSLASGLGVALAKLDTGWTGCSRRSASPGTSRRGPSDASLGGTFGDARIDARVAARIDANWKPTKSPGKGLFGT
jgi:hypothetical protein